MSMPKTGEEDDAEHDKEEHTSPALPIAGKRGANDMDKPSEKEHKRPRGRPPSSKTKTSTRR